MKLFKKIVSSLSNPGVLAWLFPILLIIPNLALAITERDPAVAKITDIVLPLGIYYLIMSLTTSIGRTVLFCLPLMVFAAFQIVLLYLYGEAIIAIDMFLNIATTNTKEVSELLSNLIIAIITVIIIYLPPIIWAIILLIHHLKCSHATTAGLRKVGAGASAAGLVMLIVCHMAVPSYSIRRNIFPVNVIANMIEAINRTVDTSNYHSTSMSFSFSPTLTHDKELKEIYVLVVGETSRADNWQLFGYDRPTNPRLSRRENVHIFPKTLSESNTTHKSVPMMLSPLTAINYGDSIYYTKGICDAFNEAGFNTAFFSNQQRNHSFIDFFAGQAQTTEFIRDNHPDALDTDLVNHMKEFIDRSPADKIFITLHCYGSHFNYHERYNKDNAIFTPDQASEATEENRQELINAYDNSIVFTDLLLDEIIAAVDSLNVPGAVIYTSDHGEDIFDDPRGRFLHASPTTTFTQIHVPMLIWTSNEYNEQFTDKVATIDKNSALNVSSSRSIFPTTLSLAGIQSEYVDSTADLMSPKYSETTRMYLNDYNEAVNLIQAGFRKYDIERAESLNISIN